MKHRYTGLRALLGKIRRIVVSLTFLICVAGAYYLLTAPSITRLSPFTAVPGSVIMIEGRNFGDSRGDSRVMIDGVSPTGSSYTMWSSSAISLRIPLTVDSGLLTVVTRWGRSNPALFMSQDRIPIPVGPDNK